MSAGDVEPVVGPPLAAYGVHLADVQHVLSLFTQGISGRYLHLRPIAEGGMRGGAVSTDGAAIYLPESVEHFANTRHNFAVYRIAVLHQLGFYENGSFGFSLAVAQRRIPALASMEPQCPPQASASDLERFFALWESPALMRRVFVTLEDLRIDCALRRRYPGARADLERVLAHALLVRPPADSRMLGAFPALLEALVQYSLGGARDNLVVLDGTGVLPSMLDAAAMVEGEQASVYDSARAAMTCYQALAKLGLPRRMEEHPPRSQHLVGNDAGTRDAGPYSPADEDALLGASTVDFRGELNAEFVEDDMMGGGTVGTLPGEAEPALDRSTLPPEATGKSLRGPGGRHTPGIGNESTSPEVRSFLYDEWDYHNQHYIKGWCRLYESRLAGDNHDFIRELRRRHAVLAHQITRRFRFIKPESLRRMHRLNDGEELELDGIIEAIIDRRAGQANDDRVYSRRSKALRDVAAAFLLDMSASTDYAIPDPAGKTPMLAAADGEEDYPMHLWGGRAEPDDSFSRAPVPPPPAKRRVIDVARESLALMSEALGTLGDSHAVYGFSGQGRENVEFFVAKEFEDKVSARTWAALGAMKAQRSTRMGPAIRHVLVKLERQTARMKVLIVVSDGYPQDCDYGPDRVDDEYGIQDTARALKEAEAAGVQTFCVTIDPSGHDYLRRMCSENRYLVIDEVQDLPAKLTKVYRALTV